MEVRLRRQPVGYVYWPSSLITFGLFALLISLGERHFAVRMETVGVLTRGGTRIAWNEITGLNRTKGILNGGVLSDEYPLKSSKGKVSLPMWRVENAREATDYLVAHLPPSLRQRDR